MIGDNMIVRDTVAAYSNAMDEYFANQSSSRSGNGNVYVGGNNNDTVVNYANGTKILTGGGDDTVTTIAGGVVIDTADGDDSIIAVGMGTDISAGSGNDKIYSQMGNVNIDRGTGADEVFVTGQFNVNIAQKADEIADVIRTPGFSFQYVKNQGLLLETIYSDMLTESDEEDDDESEIEINIYQ